MLVLAQFFILLFASVLEASPTRVHNIACQGVVPHGGYHLGILQRKFRDPLRAAMSSDGTCRNPNRLHAVNCRNPMSHQPQSGKHGKHPYRAGPLRAASSDDACLNPISDADALKIESFIQLMKRAMELDDLSLYKSVLFDFFETEMSEAETKEFLAQLPVLASLYGAKRIWDSMQLDPNDQPNYHIWINISKSLYDTEIDATGFVPIEYRSRHAILETTYAYHQDWWLNNLDSERSISEILRELETQEQFLRRLMSRSQTDLQAKVPKPATRYDIVKVFEGKTLATRRHQLHILQKRIQNDLSQGTYIMDDIIGSSTFMVLLAFRYIDDKDPAIQQFLRFLLKKGAPISEKNFFQYYSHLKSILAPNEEVPDKYKRLARLFVRYCSNSAEDSLSHILKTHRKYSEDAFIPGIIEAYHNVFPDMNFQDMELVQSLGHFVTVSHDYHKNGPLSDKAIDLFSKYGLTSLDVNHAYLKLDAKSPLWSDPDQHKFWTKGLESIWKRLMERTFSIDT